MARDDLHLNLHPPVVAEDAEAVGQVLGPDPEPHQFPLRDTDAVAGEAELMVFDGDGDVPVGGQTGAIELPLDPWHLPRGQYVEGDRDRHQEAGPPIQRYLRHPRRLSPRCQPAHVTPHHGEHGHHHGGVKAFHEQRESHWRLLSFRFQGNPGSVKTKSLSYDQWEHSRGMLLSQPSARARSMPSRTALTGSLRSSA